MEKYIYVYTMHNIVIPKVRRAGRALGKSHDGVAAVEIFNFLFSFSLNAQSPSKPKFLSTIFRKLLMAREEDTSTNLPVKMEENVAWVAYAIL